MKFTVLGCGGWGLAFATLLHGNGHEVVLWTPFAQEAALLRDKRGNEALLPGIRLPDDIEITEDLTRAEGSRVFVIAVPSFAVFDTAQMLLPHLSQQSVVVLLSKGFDQKNGYCLLSDSVEKALCGKAPLVALTGPSHAEEVSRAMPTAVVAASRDQAAAELVQDAVMNSFFRVYTSPDVVGAELGGAMKNIMALVVGISDGAGFGDNTKAMLMTRGIAEMARFGVRMGGKASTFAGLSGVGDLIVTCTSNHSRNRRAGLLIGQGVEPQEAVKRIGAVVEGYYAAQAVHELTRGMEIDLPISRALYSILYEGAQVSDVVTALLSRGKKQEPSPEWGAKEC